MFATLLGALPLPPGDPDDPEELIRAAIRAQEAAGLEPITDGRLFDPGFERVSSTLVARAGVHSLTSVRKAGDASPVEAWRLTAAQTGRAVKQALPGPYSIGRRALAAGQPAGREPDARAVTFALADAMRADVIALAEAGCPLVEIEETEAHTIGTDQAGRELFQEAHRRLSEGIEGTHLSLSIVGGSAWEAGLDTLLAGRYASLAVDLVAGPDNWNLVTRLPGDRGVIAGALPAKDSPADTKEVLLWAARYAAGANRRGLERVGLGSAGSWADLTWEAAVRKMNRLGEAARLAATPGGEELARAIDPRAVNARAAATGEVAPGRRRPQHPGGLQRPPGTQGSRRAGNQ